MKCVDCGQPTPQQSRCAAGCGKPLCDDCYLRHCEEGCTGGVFDLDTYIAWDGIPHWSEDEND